MKINIENFIIRLLYMVAAGIIVAQTLGFRSLSSLLFTGTFFLVVVFWFVVTQRKITKLNMLGLLIVVIAMLCVLLNAMFTNTILSFGYVKKVIMFASSILFFAAASESNIDDANKLFLNRTVNFLTCFMIMMYFVQSSAMHTLYGRVTKYLVFRFTNPNLTALFLTCILFYKIVSLFQSKNKINKVFDFMLVAFLVKFVIETKSRNCLLVMALFFIQVLVFYKMPKIKIFTKKIYAKFMAIMPLLFSILYMLLINFSYISRVFSFLLSEGKGLDSRYTIWSFAFKKIYQSPIIGAYSQISYGTGESQMHNSHMDILASYGVIVLLLTCVLVYLLLWNKIKNRTNNISVLYMIAFASILLVGIGEAAIFSGGMGIYIFAGVFLLLNGVGKNEESSIYK